MPSVQENPTISGALLPVPAPAQTSNASPVQPRQPTSLQGLLRFAMEATKAEDAPNDSEFQPMDEERKKFLEEALKSMTIDVIELLQKQIKTLQKVGELPSEGDISQELAALETILDYIDSIDIANDFHKIGGLMILYPCLKCAHPKIRAGGCELIAVLCQNNPYCQKIILENEFIPMLLNLLDHDPDPTVATKSLYAISGIVRDNVEGFSQLIHYNGLSVLLKSLSRNDEKIITKTCFMLAFLCRTQSDLKSRLIFLDYLPTLISLISEERRPSHEHVLGLLVSLVEENPTAINECKNAKYNLKEVLQNYIAHIRNKEEFLEEEQYCKRLLHLLFGY